jgi:hypothetical protein
MKFIYISLIEILSKRKSKYMLLKACLVRFKLHSNLFENKLKLVFLLVFLFNKQ